MAHIRPIGRLSGIALLAGLAAILVRPMTVQAGDLTIELLDRDGKPVPDVVVTLTPADGRKLPEMRPPAPAVMDQNHRAFVPQVLVVPVGTPVSFPNNDSISHQVYSFSPAKRFQLPLYKGATHSPVTFEREGLVVLGCNIHDEMAGYIYVTAAPRFGMSDSRGSLELNALPGGEYRLTAWSPIVADAPSTLTRVVRIDPTAATKLKLQLSKPLRGRPEPRPRRNDWDY